MKVITSIRDMREIVTAEIQKNNTIGLTPTMGFLHEGHLSLIHQAQIENDIVVASLFVNPLQFGPNEDFDQYPRDFEKDKRVAEEAGVDFLFCPSTEEMYPGQPMVSVSVNKRADVLCGQSRPGHFDGVATVLTKLFHVIRPQRVYFGMKDAQQAAVVEGMVEDFNFELAVVTCPTVREQDGLALSSRNVHLSETERREAPTLYQSLQHGMDMFRAGEQSTQHLQEAVLHSLEKRLNEGKIEYVEVLSYPDLTRKERCTGKMIIALAVQFQSARLIDNVLLNEEAAPNVGAAHDPIRSRKQSDDGQI